MFILMTLIMIVYVAFVIHCARKVIFKLNEDMQKQKEAALFLVKEIHVTKDFVLNEKKGLEEEAVKIFTLYDVAKELTKRLNESEAFTVFKEKLAEHVKFEECFFINEGSKKIKEFENRLEYFIFEILSKKTNLGYVVVRGLSTKEDQEKVAILGHQLALALKRSRLYQEIEHIAITDGLTELYTRRYILERFTEELERAKIRKMKVSFLMIDVDFFKKFNDQYGHLTGDQVLRKIGFIIKENIREIDIAGRYGGEEFCVVLPDTDLNGAQYVAERIRQATENTSIEAYDAVLKATVSIGISNFPKYADTMEELIECADKALYQAKQEGRNRTVYS